MTREFAVTVAGGTITAWQQGEGQHVLLLHGGPGVSDYTESLAAELEDGYSVTRYQQRGVPPSTTDGPFNVETHMADAIAVMDGAGIEKAYLLGHSWGGHLAFHLAVAHQDRFLGLLPIDPLGAIGDGGLKEMGAIMEERVGAEQAARAEELDARAQSPDGSPDDAVEAFRIMWPGNFASPEKALPMPPTRVSLVCNKETFESIVEHFKAETLARGLSDVRLRPCSYWAPTARFGPATTSQRRRCCLTPPTTSRTPATSSGWSCPVPCAVLSTASPRRRSSRSVGRAAAHWASRTLRSPCIPCSVLLKWSGGARAGHPVRHND
jgi:pimeloyl-ACP methyl ester carboxylesterase